mmetsp:Transcript_6838/g.14646  ORF Transcript_6838/g.14646 Transcript_6838/m.14646 type:complete len:227 (-) Transcript_6838:27-707(-)
MPLAISFLTLFDPTDGSSPPEKRRPLFAGNDDFSTVFSFGAWYGMIVVPSALEKALINEKYTSLSTAKPSCVIISINCDARCEIPHRPHASIKALYAVASGGTFLAFIIFNVWKPRSTCAFAIARAFSTSVQISSTTLSAKSNEGNWLTLSVLVRSVLREPGALEAHGRPMNVDGSIAFPKSQFAQTFAQSAAVNLLCGEISFIASSDLITSSWVFSLGRRFAWKS